MRHLKNALVVALVVLLSSLCVLAQTARRTDDPRNLAPTVGTGGAVGGPTGLFTVYDGQTLRAGEYTFSIAYSNYDRDPGNVDISEIPVSFQVGLNDYLEAFFTTDAYRAVKVNSPRNLSGFYLPNSRVRLGTGFTSAPAIVLAPRGSGTALVTGAVFRPTGSAPFVNFPYIGGAAGNFGLTPASAATVFGFPVGTAVTLGPPRAGSGNGADLFPGIGSVVGGILPGLVLQTGLTTVGAPQEVPTISTIAPSYLPDAPFLNRTFGESAFSTFNAGVKFRFTGPNNPIGIGVMPFIRFYADKADDLSGFNQLQRGASPGGDRFDIGAVLFGDARVARWANISGNVGYIRNSSVKANFPNGDFTLLDRGDEFTGAIGIDFPVNRYFQPIGEVRATKYVGGRTPNAFEQDPVDVILGARVFPTRWMSLGGAFRYNVNQQDADIFDDGNFGTTVTGGGGTISTSITGAPPGFLTSDDPYGFILSFSAGRRNARVEPTKPNTPAQITGVNLSDNEIVLPDCPEGLIPGPGSNCSDNTSVSVTTTATDAENDPLVYQYTVSAGRVTGSGANVTWDLSGVRPGTYTISVGVDDGCGVCGQPTTREVRVVECTGCIARPTPTPEIQCPTVTGVSAVPPDVKANEIITFTADVTLNGTNPTYNWTVSSGTIESGQGTPSITVRAPDSGSVTATVSLGSIDPSCRGEASATSTVLAPTGPILIDEYGVLKPDPEKGRLDNAAERLNADPNGRLFIITYGSTRGGQREAQRRADFAVRYLTQAPPRGRGLPASSIVTINGGASPDGTAKTRIYFVPAGATEPTP